MLTFGIIGCGMIADFHIKDLLKSNLANIKWVCDISKNATQKVQHKYKIPFACESYQDLLNDEMVDAIIICTPPHTHYEIISQAIKSKKHILIEKPIVISQKEAHKLQSEIALRPDLVILDCSARHSRLQPKFIYLKKLINSGVLGHVYYIHHRAVYRASRPGVEYHPQAKWFFNKQLSGGGPLLDWGVYDLSFHLGILNDVPNLEYILTNTINGLDCISNNNPEFTVEEHGMVAMKFSNNLFYFWERASNAHNQQFNETRIYGSKGGVSFSYLIWESNKIQHYYLDEDGNPRSRTSSIDLGNHTSNTDDSYAMCDHFIRCILYGEKPILPIKISFKHLNIIFKTMHS